jgi:hypothetical protein
MEHIPHPQALLKEIERISKKDTVIVITIPNERYINWLKNLLFSFGVHKLLFREKYRPSRRMENEWHLHTFDIKKFKALIEGQFIIEKIVSIPTFFLPLRHIFSLRKVF